MNAELPTPGCAAREAAVPPMLNAGGGLPGDGDGAATTGNAGISGRWLAALGLALAVGAAILLYLHRPAGQYFYPRCSLHASTGLLCPGCGGLRASHELLHGRVLEALRSNALLVLGLPTLAGWTVWRRARSRPVLALSSAGVWWVFGGVLVYTILRNLPGAPFHWLAP